MSGIFNELLTPIQEFSFVYADTDNSSFINTTNDFGITKSDNNIWSWSPSHDMWYKHGVKSHKVYQLFYQSSQTFSTREAAKQAALSTFENILPSYFSHVSQKLIGRYQSNSYSIKNTTNPKAKVDDFYIYGRNGQWALLSSELSNNSVLKSMLCENMPVNSNLRFKTRKQILVNLHNILSNDLYHFYDQSDYEYSLENSTFGSKLWWNLFIKPEINLKHCFEFKN